MEKREKKITTGTSLINLRNAKWKQKLGWNLYILSIMWKNYYPQVWCCAQQCLQDSVQNISEISSLFFHLLYSFSFNFLLSPMQYISPLSLLIFVFPCLYILFNLPTSLQEVTPFFSCFSFCKIQLYTQRKKIWINTQAQTKKKKAESGTKKWQRKWRTGNSWICFTM